LPLANLALRLMVEIVERKGDVGDIRSSSETDVRRVSEFVSSALVTHPTRRSALAVAGPTAWPRPRATLAGARTLAPRPASARRSAKSLATQELAVAKACPPTPEPSGVLAATDIWMLRSA